MPPRTRKPAKPEIVKDDFVTTVDGVEIALPSLTYLKPGVIRKTRHLGEIDQLYTLLEMSLGDAQLEALDNMDPEEYSKLLEDWRDHSGVSLGESDASTN